MRRRKSTDFTLQQACIFLEKPSIRRHHAEVAIIANFCAKRNVNINTEHKTTINELLPQKYNFFHLIPFTIGIFISIIGSPRGNSSVGRARPCQGRGRGSESLFPLEKREPPTKVVFFFYIVIWTRTREEGAAKFDSCTKCEETNFALDANAVAQARRGKGQPRSGDWTLTIPFPARK